MRSAGLLPPSWIERATTLETLGLDDLRALRWIANARDL
jgi:hypothetical protein